MYQLLASNVASSQVGNVITSVLKLICKQPNNLPKRSTVLRMNIERLSLSQTQLSQEFAEIKNTCLLTDDTSKCGGKFAGFHASDETGRFWVLIHRE